MKIETNADEKKALTAVMSEAKGIANIQVSKITSIDGAKNANLVLANIKEAIKKVDEEKHKILDPLNEARKNFLDFFRPVETALENAKNSVSSALYKFKVETEAKVAEQKKAIEEKVSSGELSFDKASTKIERVEQKTEIVKSRKQADIEIYDENKIPDEFWIIDRVRLKAAVFEAAEKGVEIPGVKKIIKEIIL